MKSCGTSFAWFASLRGSSVVAVRLRSGLIVFPVASTAKDIFAPKAQDNRHRPVRDEIKKAKAEKDKDKEGVWDGNEAEVDDEQVLRCRMIAHH